MRDTEYQSLATLYGKNTEPTPKTFIDFLDTASKTVLPIELESIIQLIEDFEAFYRGSPPLADRLGLVKAYVFIRIGDLEKAQVVLSRGDASALTASWIWIRIRSDAEPTLRVRATVRDLDSPRNRREI